MNISLSSAAEKQQKKKAKVSYGLNSSNKASVFGDDDDDDEEEEEEMTNGRDQVNRDLLREQDALRQRASAAMYDFDGTYETKEEMTTTRKETKKKESRYMKDLLQQAKKRNYERDQAHERKLAKEQEAEEGEFRGKEKFITSAYKKTLEERELWKQEEEEQKQQDEREDVTKRKDGLSGFYANFNKNVAMGGHTADTDADIMDVGGGKEERPSFLDGFEAADGGANEEGNKSSNNNDTNDDTISNSQPSFLDGFEASATATTTATGNEEVKSQTEGLSKEEEITPTKLMRDVRAEKMTQARLRYFQRRGITEQEALQESYL